MSEDVGQTVTMSQLFAEMHECIRELKEEYRGVNAKLVALEQQMAELKAEIKQLREAEEERKRLKRDVWATACRVAVTALAGGVVGWLVLGFKESVK